MRYLVCFKTKERDKIVKKVEIHTVKTDNIESGSIEVMYKLVQKYTIPAIFVDELDDNLGFLYIHPKDTLELTDCVTNPDTIEDVSDTLYG